MKKMLIFTLFLTACTTQSDIKTVICTQGENRHEIKTESVQDLDGNILDDNTTANFIADELAYKKGGQWTCTVAK